MKITTITLTLLTTKPALLKPFFKHLLSAIRKGVDGGGYSVDGKPVAEWRKEKE